MVAGEEHRRPTGPLRTSGARFELERFAWAGPNRLELSGKFVGLPDVPSDAPVLVVRGPELSHRLAAAPDSLSGPPHDRALWSAAFEWQEPPAAFDVARLELGAEIAVELPRPGAKHRRFRSRSLPVQSGGTESGGIERVRLEARLLAAQEEIRELRAALERAQEELARARADLQGERARRATDADQSREALAWLHASAEDALAFEQTTAQQLDADLREALQAIATKDAVIEQLRRQAEQRTHALMRAQSATRAEVEALRRRVARLDEARSAAEAARTEAEQLLSRLTAMRDALEDED
jgi:hypothetical protein